MFMRVDRLITELPPPLKQDPNAGAALQELARFAAETQRSDLRILRGGVSRLAAFSPKSAPKRTPDDSSAHCRNVRITGDRQFYEAAHPTASGDVPMRDVMIALAETGFNGPMRPDHGRMIWGETGRTASGLYDRALGAVYLQGLWEGVRPGASR